MAVITEQGLRDLLGLNALLLEAAASSMREAPGAYLQAPDMEDYADRLAAAFAALAACADNRALAAIVDRTSEQLNTLRRHEPDIIPEAMETLEQIEAGAGAPPLQRLEALRRYHRQCHKHAAQLVGRGSGLE